MKLKLKKLHVLLFVALSALSMVKAESCDGIYHVCGAKVNFPNETLNLKNVTDQTVEMSFVESTVTVLPTDFFKNVKNLNKILLDFVGLTELKKQDFDGADKLVGFYARGNLLKCVTDSVFQGAKNLQNISLSSNLIDHVDPNAFQGLEKLEYLDLSNNLVTEISFLKKIGSLKFLYLSFNGLRVLGDDAFQFNPKLEIIEINYNRINSLTLKTFLSVTVAKSVGLIGNECINKTITDFHISEASHLESCLQKFKFDESLAIDTCKDVEYKFNDTCLAKVNEKLVNLIKTNGTCPENQNSTELNKKIEDLTKQLNATLDAAKVNQTKLESLNKELQKNLTAITEQLSNCTATNHSADAKSSGSGGFITHFMSFIGGCVLSVIVIYGLMVRAAKRRGARDPYSPSNFVAEGYSGF